MMGLIIWLDLYSMDAFGRICVRNKIEAVNLNVFNILIGVIGVNE